MFCLQLFFKTTSEKHGTFTQRKPSEVFYPVCFTGGQHQCPVHWWAEKSTSESICTVPEGKFHSHSILCSSMECMRKRKYRQ